MGTQNRRFEYIDIEAKRQFLLNELEETLLINDRKRLGQYNTPFQLSSQIASYVLNMMGKANLSVFEPAVGSGSFLSALLEIGSEKEIVFSELEGIDIDQKYLSIAETVFGNIEGVFLNNADFFNFSTEKKYDLVISNPPYVRHHKLDKEFKRNYSKQIKEKFGITVSGLADLYIYFTILSHTFIKDDGFGVWLLPSEFLDVKYGDSLKKYLLNNVELLQIHRYDPNKSMFNDAEITSCVVIYKKRQPSSIIDRKIKFTFGSSISESEIEKYFSLSELVNKNKWSDLELEKHSNEYDTIGDYFDIKRGIATGDNKFFILDEETISKYNIDSIFLKPILPSPRLLNTNEISSDETGIPNNTKKLFLLDCRLNPEELQMKFPNTWKYIETGIGTVSERYITKNRKVWYWQEQRQTAPILISYMSRSRNEEEVSFRFIRNRSSAIAANSYLMLYPKDTFKASKYSIDDLYKKLLRINQLSFNKEGRTYGGGLKKIEPKELPRVMIPNR